MKGHLSGTKVRVFLVWLQYTRRLLGLQLEQLRPGTGPVPARAKSNWDHFSIKSCFQTENIQYMLYKMIQQLVFLLTILKSAKTSKKVPIKYSSDEVLVLTQPASGAGGEAFCRAGQQPAAAGPGGLFREAAEAEPVFAVFIRRSGVSAGEQIKGVRLKGRRRFAPVSQGVLAVT